MKESYRIVDRLAVELLESKSEKEITAIKRRLTRIMRELHWKKRLDEMFGENNWEVGVHLNYEVKQKYPLYDQN